jgi:signal transduction histidine kinase
MVSVGTSRLVWASMLATAGLAVVGWLDYRATRSELVELLRQQAVSLQHTIAAAARSNDAAGAQAEAQVNERLLDNARLMAELDRRGGLTQAFLDDVAKRNQLFRVAVFAPDGSRVSSNANQGFGFGYGGRGNPGQGFIQGILSGEQQEVVGQMHASRWGGGARVAAGVRRSGGGAIMLNADASAIEALQRQTSLDSLLGDIVRNTGQLAYLTFDHDTIHLAYGDATALAPTTGALPANGSPALTEQEVSVASGPVLEFSGLVTLDASTRATLRLGLRLDGVRRAERRLLTRLAVSLAAALALSFLVLGTLWLRQAYSTLSDKHARAEAALRRRDRLSAMGELAATVAHEVRNPLNAIAMSAQRLRREYPASASTTSDEDRLELASLLGIVESETRRIDEIVRQFLEFARPPALVPREVSLDDEIRVVVDAAASLAATHEVTLVVGSASGGVATVDPGLLRQAIDNIVRNAVEATPAGGRVTVSAGATAADRWIEVSDSGEGIPAEQLPKIFDLYFTTKANGTGVGLAVTQQIVSAHGGTIEVDSTPGAGTRMTIRLPRVPLSPGGSRG